VTTARGRQALPDDPQKSFSFSGAGTYHGRHSLWADATSPDNQQSLRRDGYMAHQIRFIMVGGFLGAGKTTTLARLARHYQQQGLNVGVVTNDQATDLVDTNSLRSQGFDVGEVAGSCFCCNFNGLLGTMEKLGADHRPDVILAEPVGSCTDLVATVVQPLKQLFQAEFSIAPYCVILKPGHGERILKNESGAGFSPKAAYIFKKQLEEADAVLINRVDQLAPAEIDELARLVDRHYPGRPILKVSARAGTGFEGLLALLEQRGDFGRRVLDIDYDIYAEGEAELGWLNASIRVSAPAEFGLDDLLLDILKRLAARLDQAGAETAHLKAIGLWEGFFGVANLVSRDRPPELSLPSNCFVREFDLIVNARVATDPEILQELVEQEVAAVCTSAGARAEFRQTQCFRPGRPTPTHRLAVAE
jgi:Ni2+-binding GTPase involved in maturation of urease and hydrogenase